jgi:2-desacetyl-2-hydroxyethyl bacteriochlorophyllide A dehydrogenase
MQASALICDVQQRFSLQPVILPDPGAGRVVVRTLYSGVSIGTEFALIRKKISWGPYPLCTGYQSVGVVEWSDCADFPTGTRVYCRDGQGGTLADGTPVSNVAGTHCSHLAIDPATTHGLALLPDGVPADAGSLFVMPAVGLAGVDMANPRMGHSVLVYGAGLIGLGVVAAASHRGCRVIAVDIDDSHLAVAGKLGADICLNSRDAAFAAALAEIAPDGADAVFECTGIPACVNEAIPLTRNFGTFVMQGNYGAKPIDFDFLSAHARTLTMFFPMDDGQAPCRRAVLKNMASGVLPWSETITHRVAAADAPALYARINANQAADVLGAVIHWSD